MPSSAKTKLDTKLQNYTPLEPADKTQKFLREFFNVLSPNGRKSLVEDVSGCTDDEKLRQLVQTIRTGLLIPLKAQGGKTSTATTPSPQTIEYLKSLDIERVSNSRLSQPRSHCLERDGNRCLATGYYSISQPHPRNARTTHLAAAHIIPFALGCFDAKNDDAVDRSSKILVNLRRYFPAFRQMSFTSEQINSEKNIMMLEAGIHVEFGQFNLVFEATGTPHQYRIKTFPGIPSSATMLLPRSRLVKFRVHKGNWELPDPELLKIHAHIGNFLHMSGHGEIIDKLLGDFEDCGGLAPNGSTNIRDLLAMSGLALLPAARFLDTENET